MYIAAIAFAEKNPSSCARDGIMSSRQNEQSQWPMSGGYSQQNPFHSPYSNPSTGAQNPGGELPQTPCGAQLDKKRAD